MFAATHLLGYPSMYPCRSAPVRLWPEVWTKKITRYHEISLIVCQYSGQKYPTSDTRYLSFEAGLYFIAHQSTDLLIVQTSEHRAQG